MYNIKMKITKNLLSYLLLAVVSITLVTSIIHKDHHKKSQIAHQKYLLKDGEKCHKNTQFISYHCPGKCVNSKCVYKKIEKMNIKVIQLKLGDKCRKPEDFPEKNLRVMYVCPRDSSCKHSHNGNTCWRPTGFRPIPQPIEPAKIRLDFIKPGQSCDKPEKITPKEIIKFTCEWGCNKKSNTCKKRPTGLIVPPEEHHHRNYTLKHH